MVGRKVYGTTKNLHIHTTIYCNSCGGGQISNMTGKTAANSDYHTKYHTK